jgi:transcriptional regulator with XRE-family HTH domain
MLGQKTGLAYNSLVRYGFIGGLMSNYFALLDSFTTFGDLLRYLRIRAHLTQRDLSAAVGYSEAQISRQESNKRLPSEHALKALFVPALGLENEPEIADRLLTLAKHAREQDHPWIVANPADIASQQSVARPENHNLPRQLTSFVGREKEVEQVVKMVRDHPLVTLTGAGGIGKTRLALCAAQKLTADFPDGVWLVELAPVTDPVSVPIAVASPFSRTKRVGPKASANAAQLSFLKAYAPHSR